MKPVARISEDGKSLMLDGGRMPSRVTCARASVREQRRRLEYAELTGKPTATRESCLRRAEKRLRYVRAEARVVSRMHGAARNDSRPRERSACRSHCAKASSSSDDPDEPAPGDARQHIESFVGTDPPAEGLSTRAPSLGQPAVSRAARSQGRGDDRALPKQLAEGGPVQGPSAPRKRKRSRS